jgi:hypothetical protein
VAFIRSAVESIKPDNIYILCEKDREPVYGEFKSAVVLPLKELNKSARWITFVNTFSEHSLLVIDNVLKFIFFGDGKKKYLKNISQSLNNIIVTDVVPFYTEPSEIFYPFWFLGKTILGYNSYNSFKSNHLEEKVDGSLDYSHSFSVLKTKIQDYYVQDYENFFDNVEIVDFTMSKAEAANYERAKKQASEDFTNPIKLYSDVSEHINLIDSRYAAAQGVVSGLLGKDLFRRAEVVVVNNSRSYIVRHRKRLGNINFLTFHDAPEDFAKYSDVVFMQLPVVKPYNIFYILCNPSKFYQLHLVGNNLEKFFFNKIYNNELRKQFDRYFYNAHLR